jgi:hypothetical protein
MLASTIQFTNTPRPPRRTPPPNPPTTSQGTGMTGHAHTARDHKPTPTPPAPAHRAGSKGTGDTPPPRREHADREQGHTPLVPALRAGTRGTGLFSQDPTACRPPPPRRAPPPSRREHHTRRARPHTGSAHRQSPGASRNRGRRTVCDVSTHEQAAPAHSAG